MKPKQALQRYIAFLRAINVGGHTVKMEALRTHFSRLGYIDVETFIASGNVIFHTAGGDPAVHEAQIAEELERRLGYAVATFLRTPPELMRIAEQRPFAAATFDYDSSQLYIGFLAGTLPAATARQVAALRTPVDELRIIGRELYWGCRTSFSQSQLSGAVLERTLRSPMTMRNITTVRRLAAKYA